VPIAETFAFILAQGYAGYYLGEKGERMPLEKFDAKRNHELCLGERAVGTTQSGYVANFIFIPS